MVAILLDQETVGPEQLAEIFADVPKWEHAPDGGLRIQPPTKPPVVDEEPEAAAVVADEGAPPDRPATGRKSRTLLPRMKPADAPGS
jgi:hypothetical protein